MTPARYMLDTNIVSYLAREPQGRVAQRIATLGGEGLCVSIIVAAELRYGCAKKRSAKLSQQIDAILAAIEIVPFDAPADSAYAAIRSELEADGRPIGPNDLLIAAHARALGATLVTANIGEFARVGGLALENWRD